MATLIKDASQIGAKHVRLILPTGNIIIDKDEALAKAVSDGVDLVLVQDGDIPVVKLSDFTKLEYEKQKNVKGGRAKKPKQIKIGPHTQEHDLKRFASQAAEFIAEGHPVAVLLKVKGRDKAFRDLILQKIQGFVAMVPGSKPGKVSISEDGSNYTQSLT